MTVGDGHKGVGMGVVHISVGNEGVKKGLNRRVGSGRIQHGRSLEAEQIPVGYVLKCDNAFQDIQPEQGEAIGIDGFQVMAAALDIDCIHRISE